MNKRKLKAPVLTLSAAPNGGWVVEKISTYDYIMPKLVAAFTNQTALMDGLPSVIQKHVYTDTDT